MEGWKTIIQRRRCLLTFNKTNDSQGSFILLCHVFDKISFSMQDADRSTFLKGTIVHIYNTLPTEHAVHAAVWLAKKSTILNEDQILFLIENCEHPVSAARAMIDFLLKQTATKKLFVDTHFYELSLARKIAGHVELTDVQLQKELIEQLAEHGFRDDVIAMAKKYSKRTVNDIEIISLTAAYCKRATQSSSDETELIALADAHGDNKTRVKVRMMIEEFLDHFNNLP